MTGRTGKLALYRLSSLVSIIVIIIMPAVCQAEKQIIGIIEKVSLNNTDFSISAKIDTGAKNSSLNMESFKFFRKNGEKWIRFSVINKNGRTITLERQFTRFAKIKRKEAGIQQRPVVQMDVCLGAIKKHVEVNLVNRSNFNYQMLIGRSFIQKDFIVDVDKKFTVKPVCDNF